MTEGVTGSMSRSTHLSLASQRAKLTTCRQISREIFNGLLARRFRTDNRNHHPLCTPQKLVRPYTSICCSKPATPPAKANDVALSAAERSHRLTVVQISNCDFTRSTDQQLPEEDNLIIGRMELGKQAQYTFEPVKIGCQLLLLCAI